MMIISVIVLQIIVFGSLIFFLRKIMSGDTQGAIGRLDQAYQDLLKKQKELATKIEAAEKLYGMKKEEAFQIGKKIKDQCEEEAKKKEDDIVKRARAEAEQIIAKARDSSEKNYRDIEKKVKGQQIDVAAGLLGSIFDDELKRMFHRYLVQDFIKRADQFELPIGSQKDNNLIIRTAAPLGEEEKKSIKAFLQNKGAKEASFKEEVSPDLIAGIVVQVGTLLLDGTLKNFIQRAAFIAKEEIFSRE